MDLDNTLWNGTLGEDCDEPTLRPGIHRCLEGLGQRRIAIVAVSRAPRVAAREHLARLGLLDLFDELYCDTKRKSQVLHHLLGRRRLFPEEVVFVDDEPYERAEVYNRCPGVTVLSAAGLPGLYTDPLITASSVRVERESLRQRPRPESLTAALAARMEVRVPRLAEWLRCWELLQRTNRMHCVEWRPDYDTFIQTLQGRDCWARVGLCSERGCDYGLVCLLLARAQPVEEFEVLAFTASCRVAYRGYVEAFAATCRRQMAARVRSVRLAAPPSARAEREATRLCRILSGQLPLPHLTGIEITTEE